jgi:hypothetical protein
VMRIMKIAVALGLPGVYVVKKPSNVALKEQTNGVVIQT